MLLRLNQVDTFLQRAMSSRILRLLLRELLRVSCLPLLTAVQIKFARPTLDMSANSMDSEAQEPSNNLIQASLSILAVKILRLRIPTLWLRAVFPRMRDKVKFDVLRL